MKKYLPLIALAVSVVPAIFLPNFTPAAKALGCANIDVSNQINITGSTAPSTQSNKVQQTIDPNCVGNVNVGKSTQLNVGAGSADQTRTSEQKSGGLGQNPAIPESVRNAGDVNIQVGTGTQVYTPALNSNFLPKK